MFLFLAFLIFLINPKIVDAKHQFPYVPVDTRPIEEIHQAALAEGGGKFVLYANGNRAFAARTLSKTVPDFEARFPGMKMSVIIDNTNQHAARANIQLANGSMVVDLIQLESVHDFQRWKEEGALHYYKPSAWNQIYHKFKDPNGAFTSISGTVFSMVVNTKLLPNEAEWPKSWNDLVTDPKYFNKIVASYPVEIAQPDTTLYGYKLAVDEYGFDWIAGLKAQNITIMRDSSLIPAALSSGQFSVGLFRPYPGNVTNQRFILPEEDKFVSYTVLTAIFEKSPHKEAAKLYMNWQLEKEMQQ